MLHSVAAGNITEVTFVSLSVEMERFPALALTNSRRPRLKP